MPELVIKNMRFFLAWCCTHIACDECGLNGGKSTLGKFIDPRLLGPAQFICADCARQFFQPS